MLPIHIGLVYVQKEIPFMNLFSLIIFMNSLSPIFFYKFIIMNLFHELFVNSEIFEKFIRIRTTSFWFVFAKSVLCCERPVLWYMKSIICQTYI